MIASTGLIALARLVGAKSLMFAAAYMDESGGLDRPVITVSAVVANAKQWARLERKWLGVLRREGVSVFRMSLFENRRGEFEGWPDNRRFSFIYDLSQIIIDNVALGVATCTATEDYLAVMAPAMIAGDDPKTDPYRYLLQCCLEEIHRFLRIPATERIACVFERSDGHRGAALADSYDRLLSTRIGLRSIFGPKIEFRAKTDPHATPLQVADLLAYEGYKHVTNQYVLGGERAPRKLLLRLLETRKFTVGWHDRAMLTRLLARMLSAEQRLLAGGRALEEGAE